MALTLSDSVFDAALDQLATGTRLSICSSQPANFAGIAAVSLGDVVLAGGDYTKANGDVSGRKTTVASKQVTPGATGTVNVFVIDDGVEILATTDLSSPFAVTSGVDANTGTFKLEITDPV